MSEWTPPTGPTPIAQEYPKSRVESNGVQRVINMITDLRRDLREATSNLLSTAGIFLSLTGMRIASSLTVEGNLTSTGAAEITGTTHIGGATDIDGTLNVDAATTIGGNTTIGGTLGVTGVTTLGAATSVTGALAVSGPMTVTGTLSLPAGIINNAALANPIVPDRFHNRTSGWSLGATAAVKAAVTLTTPAGFTRALVSVAATASIANSTASTVVFTVEPIVNGTAGEASYDLIAAGFVGKDSAPASELVTGLTSGATFTVQASVFTGAAIAASATNVAVVDGTVLWMR